MKTSAYISAGEPSGEQHASSLVKSLLAQSPALRMSGMGGDLLRRDGVDIIVDPTTTTAMGLFDVVKNIGHFNRMLNTCVSHILSTRPEVIILVDYPGFHIRLAKRLKAEVPEIPIIQYICPKFWAWNYRRVRKLKRYLDHILCILPFESPILNREGIASTYVGNPLMDQLDLTIDGVALRSELGLSPNRMLIGVLPGSRRGEIRAILPVLLKAIDFIRDGGVSFDVVIGAAPGMDRETLEALTSCSLKGIPVLVGRSHDLMAASDLLLAKSGTTTLEAALYGTPMVVPYLFSCSATALLARLLMRTSHFSLPNILACDLPPTGEVDPPKEILPELLQWEASPKRISSEALRLIRSPEAMQKMRTQLLTLRQILGGSGASERAAEVILSF